jgi:glycine oxidase
MQDVVVVGAGLIGCGIAYELAKRGASVTVYDRAEPARAASWAGAGMLAPYSEEVVDPALLALCAASLRAYPAFVEDLRERTGVDAQLRHEGTLHVAFDDAAAGALAAQCEAFGRNGAVASVLDRDATLAREPMLGGNVRGAVYVANEAHVDNRRLGRALVAACTDAGVRFERTAGVVLEADARRVRGIRTEHGFLAAATVVNAAGAWAGGLPGVPDAARIAVRPVAGEMLALAVPKGFTRGLVWSQHVYLVPRDDGRLLIGATSVEREFDVRVTAQGVASLLAVALRIAPVLGTFALVETWAGLRPASHDGRPYLGRSQIEGYVVAAGHYRNGILLTPVTAQAVAALIAGERPSVDLAAFDPQRAGGAPLKISNTR